jgi:hypothetical protein
MRALSWHQFSTGLRAAMGPRWALSVSGKFFERLDRALILRRVTRAGADVREAELVQELAHRALMGGDPEAIEDHPLQVDPTPAHHAMHGSVRTGLDEAGQLGLLLGGEAGRVAFGPGVFEPARAALVEAVNPISQGLPIRAASARFMPSTTAANESSRRLWLAFLVVAASRRSSDAE